MIKCQPHKKPHKHTQIIRQLLPMNCVSVFDHFVALAFKRLRLRKQVNLCKLWIVLFFDVGTSKLVSAIFYQIFIFHQMIVL